MRYIKENVYIDFKQSEFIDCLGYCGVPSLYASSFGFKVIKSIECNELGLEKAKSFNSQLNRESPTNASKISFSYGSMQDYFSYDANVLYLDTNIICRGIYNFLSIIKIIIIINRNNF